MPLQLDLGTGSYGYVYPLPRRGLPAIADAMSFLPVRYSDSTVQDAQVETLPGLPSSIHL